MIFSGTVTPGGILTFMRRIREFKGREVTITVSLPAAKGSQAQLAYIHAVPIRILADFFGDSVASTKLNTLGECFGWTETKASNKQVPIKPSFAELTKAERSYFIDWVIPWAMTEFEVVIPLPQEGMPS